MLLQIVRQPDDESMRRLAKEITSKGLTREDAREVRRQEMGPRVAPEVETLYLQVRRPRRRNSRLELRFRRSQVEASEIAAALRSVADDLEGDN